MDYVPGIIRVPAADHGLTRHRCYRDDDDTPDMLEPMETGSYDTVVTDGATALQGGQEVPTVVRRSAPGYGGPVL
ncbi:hypothetical protein [Arthrobacter livingstonensis]|uniref:hypothetical protein n=1 Tax=Arthrobacter livingstonensis TaxID=670078 RepID=UPI0011B7AE95|nr:hypothetical protein [Arthrobacter livingstonensis]